MRVRANLINQPRIYGLISENVMVKKTSLQKGVLSKLPNVDDVVTTSYYSDYN